MSIEMSQLECLTAEITSAKGKHIRIIMEMPPTSCHLGLHCDLPKELTAENSTLLLVINLHVRADIETSDLFPRSLCSLQRSNRLRLHSLARCLKP